MGVTGRFLPALGRSFQHLPPAGPHSPAGTGHCSIEEAEQTPWRGGGIPKEIRKVGSICSCVYAPDQKFQGRACLKGENCGLVTCRGPHMYFPSPDLSVTRGSNTGHFREETASVCRMQDVQPVGRLCTARVQKVSVSWIFKT